MRKFLALLLIVTGTCLTLVAQSDFDSGMTWFRKRAEGSVGLTAKPAPIEAAIYFLKKAMAEKGREQESGITLMKCYFFKGCFVEQDEEKKIAVFAEGKKLGESLCQKYPNCPATQFWYLTCLGKWAEFRGGWAAAKEGVAEKMKTAADKIISVDPRYHDAAGYRALGLLHLKVPYIPFVISWPDNDDGLVALENSVKIAPSSPGNQVSYAEALYANGETERAIAVLKRVQNFQPRADLFLEDKKEIEDAKILLRQYIED